MANKWNYERNQSRTLFHHGNYSGILASLLYNTIVSSDLRNKSQIQSTVFLSGSIAGYYFGKQIADRNLYSEGALTTQTWSILPLSATIALATAIETDMSERGVLATFLTTTTAGLATGKYFYSNMPIPWDEGIMIAFSTFLGFGLGGALVDDVGTSFMIPAGGLFGFGLSHIIIKPFKNRDDDTNNAQASYNLYPTLIPEMPGGKITQTKFNPGIQLSINL